tara:strand:- start:35582 stop:37897 length:2316 start_codon:yes stop_codon:yes gene_type:complete
VSNQPNTSRRLSRTRILLWLHYLVPLAVLLACVVLRWQDVPLVGQLRMSVFDTYQRIAPRDFEDVGVRIIDIDEPSLEKMGQWPWPRTRLAELVYRLRLAGAQVVGFDMVFAEPDRTSPARVVHDWPKTDNTKELEKLAETLPDHDLLFAEFINGVGQIVTAVQLTTQPFETLPRQVGNFSVSGETGRQLADFIPVLPGATTNLAAIEDAAAGNALINVSPEQDGVVRRVPLMLALDHDEPLIGKPVYPTLSMEVFRVLQNAPRTMNVRLSGASGTTRWTTSEGVSAIRVGAATIPTDQSGQMWVHFTGHRPDRYISAADVLDGSLPVGTLENTVVLVGTSAAGLLDLRSSPLDPVLPGVEVHAEMLEQMLLGQFLTRPYWIAEIETLVLLLVGMFFVLAIPQLGAVWPALIGGSMTIAAIGFSWWAYISHQILIDPVYAAISLIAVYLIASSIGFMRTEGERNQVRAAFGNYLSPALVEQLARHPERLRLGGETRNMTLLFCDVRGFTAISEGFKSNPQGLTRLINRLLTPLSKAILDHEGTIDKYMGDCIMAFWNAPLDVPDHAGHACQSALAMFDALGHLNARRAEEAAEDCIDYLPLNVGIGINSGDCLVGNMGSDQRFDYSVLGDAVNLAARLESQSKNYGVGIVIGAETAREVGDRFAVLELDLITVKGKTEAVRIFTLLGDDVLAHEDGFAILRQKHGDMIARYRDQDWDGAETLTHECRLIASDLMDQVDLTTFYNMYRDRIAAFRNTPPPEDWDGVFIATSK